MHVRGGALVAPDTFASDAGLGVRATVDGHDVVVGRATLFPALVPELSDAIAHAGPAAVPQWSRDGMEPPRRCSSSPTR